MAFISYYETMYLMLVPWPAVRQWEAGRRRAGDGGEDATLDRPADQLVKRQTVWLFLLTGRMEVEEQFETQEVKEGLERLEGFESRWGRYLALTTALVAVLAAVASLESGNLANSALLAKDDAVLFQSKASDVWNQYQAKSIKLHLLEARPGGAGDPPEDLDRYRKEQGELKTSAERLESQVEESSRKAEGLLERHHPLALAVTTFQIAIAMSAISALLQRKAFWLLSIAMTVVGIGFFAAGLF